METSNLASRTDAYVVNKNGILLEQLFSWKLDAIRNRVAKRLGWSSSFSQKVENEYRRFIFMTIDGGGTKYGMAGPVDEFWHEHIVDTHDYLAMCTTLAGKYIHHCPSSAEDSGPNDEYERTLRDLERLFGPVSKDVWPSPEELKCMGKACKGCKSLIS